MRIFILANSQGTAAGDVALDRTYPMLARDALSAEHEVHVLAFSGWSVSDFNTHLDNVLGLSPDLVVAQLGIVECSRRILSGREKRLLSHVPGSRRLTKALHDRRQSVIRARHRFGLDTRLFRPDQFERELRSLVDRVEAVGGRSMPIEIPPFGPRYEAEHFPLINDDIELFNGVIRQLGGVALLSADDPLESIWVDGTVHFNDDGHALFAERLVEQIRASADLREMIPGEGTLKGMEMKP